MSQPTAIWAKLWLTRQMRVNRGGCAAKKSHLSRNRLKASPQLVLNTRLVPLLQRAACPGCPLVAELPKNPFLASGGQVALNTRLVPLLQRATCDGCPLVSRLKHNSPEEPQAGTNVASAIIELAKLVAPASVIADTDRCPSPSGSFEVIRCRWHFVACN